MIPVISCISESEKPLPSLQVGPFVVNPGTRTVSVGGWPGWEPDVLPHRWFPVAYSPYGEGGIWVVGVRETDAGISARHSVFAVLLNGAGDRVGEPVPLLRPSGRFLQSFREWALVGDAVFREGKLWGRVSGDGTVFPDSLPRWRLGPGGVLLGADGRRVSVEGDLHGGFDWRAVLEETQRALTRDGIHVDVPEIQVLGWDERMAWLLLRSEWRMEDRGRMIRLPESQAAIVGVDVSRPESVSLSVLLGMRAAKVRAFVPLPDGGWLVDVIRKPEAGGEAVGRALLIRLPGRDAVVEVSPSTMAGSMGFFPRQIHGVVPLKAGAVVLLSDAATGGAHVLILDLDDRPAGVSVPVFSRVSWADALRRGWGIVFDGVDGRPEVVMFNEHVTAASAPAGVWTRSTIQKGVLGGKGGGLVLFDVITGLNFMLTVLVPREAARQFAGKSVVAVCRFADSRIEVVQKFFLDGVVRHVMRASRGPGGTEVLLRLRKNGREKHISVLVLPDGQTSITERPDIS